MPANISRADSTPRLPRSPGWGCEGLRRAILSSLTAHARPAVKVQPGHPGWEPPYCNRESFQSKAGTVYPRKERGSHAELNIGVAATAPKGARSPVISSTWETFLPSCFHFHGVQQGAGRKKPCWINLETHIFYVCGCSYGNACGGQRSVSGVTSKAPSASVDLGITKQSRLAGQ